METASEYNYSNALDWPRMVCKCKCTIRASLEKTESLTIGGVIPNKSLKKLNNCTWYNSRFVILQLIPDIKRKIKVTTA